MPNTIDPPRIVTTQDMTYASIHLRIPRSEIETVLRPTLQELFATVKAQALPIVPWMAHHLTLSEGDFDFEACLPVDPSFVATGRVERGLWPAGPVARTVYQGDYPGLPAAWHEFNAWIKQQGHAYAGHIYEHYVVNQGMTKIPGEFRTEMSWPLLTSAAESEQA